MTLRLSVVRRTLSAQVTHGCILEGVHFSAEMKISILTTTVHHRQHHIDLK